MVARRILKWPDKMLLAISEPILEFEESTRSLAKDLVDTVKVNYGAGLAATQIGDKRACCVISSEYVPSLPDDPNIQDYVFIANPVIEKASQDFFEWRERCLSVDGVSPRVKRFKDILVTYQNSEGKIIKAALSDEESATVQHETDHLVGKLLIHRLQGVTRMMTMKKLKKSLLKSKKEKKSQK